MGMEFRGYDDDNVPIYVYVPDEPGKVEKLSSVEAPTISQAKPVEDTIDIPNPFASFCIARGGTYDGTASTCKLPSGVTCDAQEYYYGTCGENKINPTAAVGIAIIIGILAAAVFLKD